MLCYRKASREAEKRDTSVRTLNVILKTHDSGGGFQDIWDFFMGSLRMDEEL